MGRKRLLSIFSVLLIFMLAMSGCSSSTQTANSDANTNANTNAEKGTDFPTKPIQLVIPYAAGGGTDVTGRALANAVTKYLPEGSSVVAENKVGASGTLGLAEVSQAEPDGYRISMATTGNIAIQPNYGNTPYSYDDFEPIIGALSVPHVLVVKADAPWKTIEEWFEYVKANPGKFNYSTPGKGNTQHLNMEGIALKDGLKLNHVPFDGAAPALTALLGGHVEGAIVQLYEAMPHVDSGDLRILANTGDTKSETLDLPMVKDMGYIGLDAFTGVVAPKGTPKEVVTILHDAFKQALEDPKVVAQFEKLGIQTTYRNPEDFSKAIKEASETTGEIAKQVGM
jgi:tripartite-type tricarboxylate transporter receptor subunit TctC